MREPLSCKYVLPATKKSKCESIIIPLPIAGVVAFPEPDHVYDTSKGAAKMLTKALAVDCTKYHWCYLRLK